MVYAASGFVLLELVSIIAELLGLPVGTLKVAFILLCIGFLISIILSWFYDCTGLVGGIANGIVWTLALGPGVGVAMFVIFTAWGLAPSPAHATKVYIDGNDNAWLAAQPKGVFMFDWKDWKEYNKNNGLPHNRVYDMLEMDDGTMWFGTKKGIAIMN